MANKKDEVKHRQNITIVTPKGEKAMIFTVKSTRIEERFIMMFQMALEQIAICNMPATPMRIFLYLCGRMDFENMVHVPQKMISISLSIAQSDVSKAMKYLQDNEFLISGPLVGNSKTYKMNNAICWRGRASSLKKERLKLV